MEAGSPIVSGTEALDAFVRAAAEAPHAVALLCDIDGTISPIAPTPAEAHVPAPFRELLAGAGPAPGSRRLRDRPSASRTAAA